MDVEYTLALRNEYLYQRVAAASLLPGGLDGGQPSEPPPRLAFAWVVGEGSACGIFFCVEQGLLAGLVFSGRQSASSSFLALQG